jgi:hypothetical protein
VKLPGANKWHHTVRVEKIKLGVEGLFCKFNENYDTFESIGTIECFCAEKKFFGKTYVIEYQLIDEQGTRSETLRIHLNFLYVIDSSILESID